MEKKFTIFKALGILPKKIKYNIFLSIFLNIVNVLLDLVSIITIYPLVSFIIDAKNTKLIKFYDDIFSNLNIENELKLQFLIIFFCSSLLIKNLILIINKYYIAKISRDIYYDASYKLYLKILSKKFTDIYDKKKSVLIKNIREIPMEFKSYFDVFINYIFNIANILIIVLGLVIFDIKTTFLLLLYAALTSFIYSIIFTKRSKKWGSEANNTIGKLYTLIYDSLSLLEEIKIHNTTLYFTNKFKKIASKWSFLHLKITFISSITRPLFETFLVLLVFFFVFFFKQNQLNVELFPIIAVYLYGAFRVLPSLVNLNILKLKQNTYHYAVNYLFDELKINNIKDNIPKKINQITNLNMNESIELKNITFRYPNSEKEILKNINLKINKNQFIGIMGSSGKGKTTLIKIILGLIEPSSGDILFDKQNINNFKKEYMNSLAYVSQKLYLINDTIKRNIAFGVNEESINLDNIWKSLKLASADKFVNQIKDKLEYIILNNGENLSGGQSQRLVIARAIYKNPQLIVLDEATSFLDKKIEEELIQDLKNLKNKITIILISHKRSSLNHCDDIYELNDNGLKKI